MAHERYVTKIKFTRAVNEKRHELPIFLNQENERNSEFQHVFSLWASVVSVQWLARNRGYSSWKTVSINALAEEQLLELNLHAEKNQRVAESVFRKLFGQMQ